VLNPEGDAVILEVVVAEGRDVDLPVAVESRP